MTRRITVAILAFLYFGIIAGVAAAHHHDAGDPDHRHCAACHLQLFATAKVPIVTIAVQFYSLESRVLPPVTASRPTQFISATASRAPPESLA